MGRTCMTYMYNNECIYIATPRYIFNLAN